MKIEHTVCESLSFNLKLQICLEKLLFRRTCSELKYRAMLIKVYNSYKIIGL